MPCAAEEEGPLSERRRKGAQASVHTGIKNLTHSLWTVGHNFLAI